MGLTEHDKSRQRSLNKVNIAKGDVVILKDPATTKLARIEKLIPSRDGTVRAAKIRVPNKNSDRNPSILRRPLQLLVPTEVKSKELF